ncbi:LOW QUALITY PROTEIN: contactin-2 [Synchiropus picturatus]
MEAFVRVLLLSILAVNCVSGGDVCVAGHDSGPVFEEQPSSVVYPDGFTEGKVVLSCRARANPAASYRWIVNGTEVPLGLDSRYVPVAGNLVISRPEYQRDTGSYQCLAINRCGTIVSRAAHLKFGYLDDFPPDSRSPQTAYQGLGTFLACQPPPHYPALTYRWIINEFPNFIKADSGRWFVSQVTGNLYLAKAEPTDSGNYFCFPTINMDITTKSIFSRPTQLTVLPEGEGGSRSLSPSLSVSGGAPPASGLRERVEVSGGSLRVSHLALEDSGMYQCVAENKHGTIYASAELRVQVQAPEFSSNPVRKLIPAARGGQVRIECRPRAAPKPSLFWSRGTELLTNSSRVTVTPAGVLWIHNISRADEGKYTCFAENYLGKANSTGHLSVRDATKITLAPANADINQGENITLQCHASHDPTMDLTFTWALNGVLLDLEDSAGPYHRVEGRETIGDLLLVDAQLNQAGVYSCTAQTVVDSASASAKLVVRGPPGPPGGLLVRNIAESSVELCWSRGYDNHSPIGKYEIFGRSSLSAEWKQMRTEPHNIEGNAEAARVVGLVPWMDYQFQVVASNILGSGELSMPSPTIRTHQSAPAVAPSGLGGGGGERSELIVTWTPMAREYQNGDGFGYVLEFRRKAESSWSAVRVPHVESCRFVYHNATLTPYTPFEVKIKAYNQRGEGPFSQVAVVHSAEEEPTAGPLSVNATALSAFEVQVSWDSVQDAGASGVLRGYEIRYWRQHEREAAADRVRTAGVEPSARVSGLRPSTRYHVAVLAYNSAGTGPMSPRTTVTTRKPPPNRAPGNLSWMPVGSWVSVRWDPVQAQQNESAVLGYKVLWKHEGQTALKILDKWKTSVKLPLPRDKDYVMLEVRSWGEGGDGPARELLVSGDTGTSMMLQNRASSPPLLWGLLLQAWLLQRLSSELHL